MRRFAGSFSGRQINRQLQGIELLRRCLAPAGGADAAAEESAPADDDVIDAEFEVKDEK